jgi:hypothetical protein
MSSDTFMPASVILRLLSQLQNCYGPLLRLRLKLRLRLRCRLKLRRRLKPRLRLRFLSSFKELCFGI